MDKLRAAFRTAVDALVRRKQDEEYLPTDDDWTVIKRDISVLANAAFPKEACGFVLVSGSSGFTDWSGVHHPGPFYTQEVDNVADWPYAQFRIRDVDAQLALSSGRCIAVWHSHPEEAAVPSEMDAELAVPKLYFVIYAVQGEDLAVFLDEDGQLVPQVIVMPADDQVELEVREDGGIS